MKKSKIIIPALGVLVLSTAASITGTVAWFTANRAVTVTAGEFAVVKTGEDLAVNLATGVGSTSVDNSAKSVTIGSNKLTDASFNHNNANSYIITPNGGKTKVLSAVALASASTSNLKRDTNVYSAITWNMTFSITFTGADTGSDLGLFFDTSDALTTYAHEKFVVDDAHVYTADEAGTYYTNPACTEGEVSKASGATQSGAATLYKKVPDSTGKGFRIAFVPTAITGNNTSIAYTKVWSPHNASANYVAATAANDALDGVAYGANTMKYYYNSSAYGYAAEAGASSALINGSLSVPADNTKTAATALSTCANYLGMFKFTTSTTVSITFTCVAWYEGTDTDVSNAGANKGLETMVTSLHFGVSDLAAA